MANLQNFRHHRQVGLLDHVGEKVKHAAEFAGTMKGIYDVGKMIYSGFQIAAPYLEAAMLVGL
jgi:hypothetical protein